MDKELTALIGNIQKFSIEDGPGVRTTVFLKGCPLNCAWCHNPEMISFKQQMIINPKNCIRCGECVKACPNNGISFGEEGLEIKWELCNSCQSCAKVCYARGITPVAKEMSVAEVMEIVVQDKKFYDETGGGITLSGGEVLSHPDFAELIIDACAAEKIDVCLDTSGYSDLSTLTRLAEKPIVKTILYDIKHVNGEKHKVYTGVDNKPILSNLKELAKNGVVKEKIILRMPLIKGINDDEEAIESAKRLFEKIGLKRVTLIAYHNLGEAKRKHIGGKNQDFEAPEKERFYQIRERFELIGMSVEFIGVE